MNGLDIVARGLASRAASFEVTAASSVGASTIGMADGSSVENALGRLAYPTVRELLASRTPPCGQETVWRAGGHTYREADSSAEDHDVCTSGGVKLYALPDASGLVTADQIGANGDGTTDNTGAIETRENAVAARVSQWDTIDTPAMGFGHALYALGSVTKKSFAWRGEGADNTKLLFNGTTGDDFITQDTTTGINSAGILSDLSLDGNDCGSIYKVPRNSAGYGADDRLRVENVRFYRGGIQLNLDDWVNAHFGHLRFDNWNDTAILLTPAPARQQASFHLTDFTCDNASGGYATATASSFCRIELSFCSTSANVGVIAFENASIEFNNHALAGNKAVFEVVTASGAARQAEIVLRNVVIKNSFAGGVDYLFHRDASGSANSERFAFWNLQMSGVGAMFGGDYPTWMTSIPCSNWMMFVGDPINGFVGLRTVSSGGTGFEFFGPASNAVVRSVKVPGENFHRVQERPDVLLAGTGSAAPGVLLRYAGKPGWTLPPGQLSRTLGSYTKTSFGETYDAAAQTDLNLLSTQVETLTRVLAAVVNDLHQSGSGSHGLFRA